MHPFENLTKAGDFLASNLAPGSCASVLDARVQPRGTAPQPFRVVVASRPLAGAVAFRYAWPTEKRIVIEAPDGKRFTMAGAKLRALLLLGGLIGEPVGSCVRAVRRSPVPDQDKTGRL